MSLLPCPFCGSAASVASGTRYDGEITWADGLGSPGPMYSKWHMAQCGDGRPFSGCGATIYGSSQDDAAGRWNRRAPASPSEPPEEKP